MLIKNIDEKEVIAFEDLIKELRVKNPAIEYVVKDMKGIDIMEKLNALEEKIDRLERKLKLVFGNNIIINGQFVQFGEKVWEG